MARHFAMRLQVASLHIDTVQAVRIPGEFGGQVKRFQMLRGLDVFARALQCDALAFCLPVLAEDACLAVAEELVQ